MYKILIVACISLLFFGCKSDSKTETQESHEGHTHIEASPEGPLVGIWEYAIAIGINDKTARERYADRWIELKSDNTFESGIGAEQNNKGHWGYDPKTSIIDFNYEIPESDIADQFKVQGVGGIELVFMGNTPRNPRGIQIKMEKIDSRPE